MQYTLNRGERGKIEIKVELARAAFNEEYQKTLAALAKTIKVEGFRPDKVPAEIAEAKIGAGRILNETASALVSKHLAEIFKKEQLTPIDSPKVAVDSLSKDQPFTFTASFTQRPEIKVGDWKTIKVKRVAAKEITDEDVKASIQNIFEAWKKQKSQSQSEESKSEDEQKESSKFIYDAHGSKIFLKDDQSPVSPNTSGVSSGSSEVDNVPDDKFAQAIGARDLAHLAELVKKDLETIAADQTEIKLEEGIFEKLIEIGQVEVPDILIEDELNRILVRLSTDLEKQGKTLEKFCEEQKTTLDELKAKWRPKAEQNVKASLILNEIGKLEKVEVSREEIDQAQKGISETNLSADQKRDLETYIAVSIFQAKTLDLVKKTITS